MPNVSPTEAYKDHSISIKGPNGALISAASQPAIMATMLEQLDVRPGMTVLEIGAGTGYNAALLAHLVGPSGRVVTVDIEPGLVAAAHTRLRELGYDRRVSAVVGDGALGYPPGAPYDRIILTVGAAELFPAWAAQLGPHGRLLLPLMVGGSQASVAFEPKHGCLESLSVEPCGFMMLRGPFASQTWEHLPLERGCSLSTRPGNQVLLEQLRAALGQPALRRPANLIATVREIWQGLGSWLGLHDAGVCGIFQSARTDGTESMPMLVRFSAAQSASSALGLVEAGSLALVTTADGAPVDPDSPSGSNEVELMAQGYGAEASELTSRLIRLLRAWDAAGRPSTREMTIRVWFQADAVAPNQAEVVVRSPRSIMAVSWNPPKRN